VRIMVVEVVVEEKDVADVGKVEARDEVEERDEAAVREVVDRKEAVMAETGAAVAVVEGGSMF
jgi:hypothetical protein